MAALTVSKTRIPCLCLAMVLWIAAGLGHAMAQQVTRSSASTGGQIVPDPQSSDLGLYYRQMEQRLLAEGRLRQDRAARGLDAPTLARNFMAIALRSEYSLRGGAASHGGTAIPLRRWEVPIRLGVSFGPSVTAGQRQHDLGAIRGVARRLQRASGHPIQIVSDRPNFHVLVLSDEERANARRTLQQIAPEMSRAAQNAIVRMRPDTLCMVVALPASDPAAGYAQAVAIVRAEHPSLMRQSCMEEELAQGMGLPNDSDLARPSIFNDDEEYGVLTRQDELMLRMLYDDSLRCGMQAGNVRNNILTLAQAALAQG
ncbi:DUF2927 domain-containing protein [Nioella nitratireducens]|uniref:DUF2927 domain-containing protein n=1 Tax=Nioella nitratireducens TaxID=1287720 RepID=UPI0008FD0050|nr:DUF2927 domain-containing protein [Nioella nitratireducens]